MSEKPDVSVVMGVHNSADTLAITLDSILRQEGIDLEFIAIDDGSTDGTGAILDDYARSDLRLRVVHQENTGLTKALIRGCAMARGRYIARQDAGGDVSLPGRLKKQVEFLDARPDVVMTACAARFVGPEGEELYDVDGTSIDLDRSLKPRRLEDLKGPAHHGAAMFQRSLYQDIGGYREAFRVAQDIDLWTRMVERGSCYQSFDLGYVARLNANGISHVGRERQLCVGTAIVRAVMARQKNGDDQAIVDEMLGEDANLVTIEEKRSRQSASFYYFIARSMQLHNPRAASRYFGKAIAQEPLHLRAWLGLARSVFGG